MPAAATSKTAYRGRFAPSPSGPLHFGSLVCALASYIDARANLGEWLIRVEDIDPPREVAGATEAILTSLHAHGLIPDEAPSFQSHNSERYQQFLAWLAQNELSYPCTCIRKRLRPLARYDRYCLQNPPESEKPAAIRLNLERAYQHLGHKKHLASDEIQGSEIPSAEDKGDFIIHRKDGLYAYQLAVSCDDAAQGITHVVRGSDLLDTTPQQILLLQLLGANPPSYAHIPVVLGEDGDKLSKQTFAPAIDDQSAQSNLCCALRFLGLAPPAELEKQNCAEILNWACEHWQRSAVPKTMGMKNLAASN